MKLPSARLGCAQYTKDMESTSRQLAKDIIVAILYASGGQLKGKTRLYKAFYFAHLFLFKDTGLLLSDWPIVRMPNGPGIDDGEAIIHELVGDGVIRTGNTGTGPYVETSFKLHGNPRLSLTGAQLVAIQKAAGYIKKKTASKLSELTHEYSRSWLDAKNGDELNIYLDVLSEDELAQGRQSIHKLKTIVDEVF